MSVRRRPFAASIHEDGMKTLAEIESPGAPAIGFDIPCVLYKVDAKATGRFAALVDASMLIYSTWSAPNREPTSAKPAGW